MDFLVKHWGAYARRFPSPFPIVSADFISRKDHWVRRTFETCNFSLILRGRGEFRRMGRTCEVVAPCVITQWPGEYLEYGPSLPEHSWDELYVTYARPVTARWKKTGLVDDTRPMWPIHDAAAVHAQIAELYPLTQSREPEAVVDRADRVCERMILETMLTRPAVQGEALVMQDVLFELKSNLGREIDFNELAARHGFSNSTFRRRWSEVTSTPPARYLQELRMREACRRLVETKQPIHEIAAAVGFVDELYFSRRFRQEMRMAPRDYRKAYQIGRS